MNGKDKICVITGGAQGIGRGSVEHFLHGGWQVAALDADAEALVEGAEIKPAIGCLRW